MGEPMIWDGINVDVWGPIQTMSKRWSKSSVQWYSGYDVLSYDDLIDPIPLDIRYQSFTQRLDKALKS